MNKAEFENFLGMHSREELLEFQSVYGRDALREHFNLSYGNLKELINIMDLHITKDDANKKRKSTWSKKETSIENKLNNICKLISPDDLRNYYIIENHSFDETQKYFKLNKNDLLRLIKEYNCYKPKSLSHRIAEKTWLETLGVANPTKSEIIKEKSKYTCLLKYDVENPFQSFELMTGVKEKKEKHFGLGKCNNPDKNKETRIKNSGSLEESYRIGHEHCVETWLDKYGYDNIRKVPEIKEKILNNTRFYHGSNSKPNLVFKDKLIEAGLYKSDEENREFILGTYSYDFKIGNNLIEINPYATHNSSWGIFNREGLDKKYHYNKSRFAEYNEYRCIHIFDWDDINKIINLLKTRERIYARQCIIKEVSREDVQNYINLYHLQGYSKDQIRIGLYYNNELVSIMTFGKPRYNKNFEYELIRYCSHYYVVGGAEKLFKYFINTYFPKSIISYCDTSKFNGDVYKKLGFKLERINIGKHWYNPTTNEHITDNLLRQRGFDQLFNASYGKGTSNEELMLKNGFVEIYDAGQATYIYERA